jgi:GABA permease
LHSPLRSEADALRWVVAIAIGCASVIALALLASSIAAVIWAAALLGFGAAVAWRSSRGTPLRRAEPSPGGQGERRLLVVAGQAVGDRALLAEIRDRCGDRRGEVLVVTPALTGSRAALWSSDVDASVEEARKRMEISLRALEKAGLSARGQVGDPDPSVAIEDALRAFAADEVIIATQPPDRASRLEHGVVERAREATDVPVTQIVVDLDEEI